MNMKIKTLLLVDTKYEIIKDIFEKLKDNKKQKINVHQKLTIQPKIYDKKSGDILFILETFIYDKKMIKTKKYSFYLAKKYFYKQIIFRVFLFIENMFFTKIYFVF